MTSPCIFSSSSDGMAVIRDLSTKNTLVQYRDNASIAKGTTLIYGNVTLDTPPTIDFFASTQAGKPSIHLYNWARDAPVFRCAMGENITCLASSRPESTYIAGGSASGKLYLWEIGTGELLRIWQAHYKPVTAMTWSSCGTLLATSGADGIIHVWDVLSLLDAATIGDLQAVPIPHITWSGHTLPITQLHFSNTGSASSSGVASRLISSSLDRTVRWWDIASKQCVLNISMPAGVSTFVADSLDKNIFVGCVDGNIHQISSVTAIEKGLGTESQKLFSGHTGAITCMALGVDGNTLFSGSEDTTVRCWNIAAGAQLYSMEDHRAPITTLIFLHNKPNSIALSNRHTQLPHLPLAPLKKHVTVLPLEWRQSQVGSEEKSSIVRGGGVLGNSYLPRDNMDIAVLKDPVDSIDSSFKGALDVLLAVKAEKDAKWVSGSQESEASEVEALKARIAELESENQRWKAVNNKLLAAANKRTNK